MAENQWGWPRLLRRSTACLYLDVSAAQFEREMIIGRLPQPVMFGGAEHWSRVQLDEWVERLTGERIPDWRASNKHYAPDHDQQSANVERRFLEARTRKKGAVEVREVYSVAALAEQWGVSDSAVRSLIKSGELEAFRLGGKLIRVTRVAVEAFERARETSADIATEHGGPSKDPGSAT